MAHEIKRRPGGRSQRVRAAVLAAANRLASGSEPVTVAALAAAAGVSEVTIYRRWRTAENVLLDAAVQDVGDRLPIRPSGDLRLDLTKWAQAAERSLQTSRGRRLLAAVVQVNLAPGPWRVEDTADLLESRRAEIQAVLDHGSPPADLTVEAVLDHVLAPLYLRLLFGYADSATVADLVDELLDRATPRQLPGGA